MDKIYVYKLSEFYTDIIQPYIYDNALFDCSFTRPRFYYYSARGIKAGSVCAGSVSRSKSSTRENPLNTLIRNKNSQDNRS